MGAPRVATGPLGAGSFQDLLLPGKRWGQEGGSVGRCPREATSCNCGCAHPGSRQGHFLAGALSAQEHPSSVGEGQLSGRSPSREPRRSGVMCTRSTLEMGADLAWPLLLGLRGEDGSPQGVGLVGLNERPQCPVLACSLPLPLSSQGFLPSSCRCPAGVPALEAELEPVCRDRSLWAVQEEQGV